MTQPQLWVFTGPNGAGKSTFVDRYVRGRIPVVNPDTIAQSLDSALVEGGRAKFTVPSPPGWAVAAIR